MWACKCCFDPGHIAQWFWNFFLNFTINFEVLKLKLWELGRHIFFRHILTICTPLISLWFTHQMLYYIFWYGGCSRRMVPDMWWSYFWIFLNNFWNLCLFDLKRTQIFASSLWTLFHTFNVGSSCNKIKHQTQMHPRLLKNLRLLKYIPSSSKSLMDL